MEMVWDHVNAFVDYQNSFESAPLRKWMTTHAEVPIFVTAAYLCMVHWLPLREYKPMKLRALFALWNFFLATFSTVGAYYTVPELLSYLRDPKKGFYFSFCADPRVTFYDGAIGFYIALFVLSKVPEMIDTFFLVVQRKPVIFLHWYHHVTVMLYCWHAYINNTSGLWFAAMNYSVHSIMYTYYFFMAINMRGLVKPLAPLITSMQIIQMIVGFILTGTMLAVQDDEQPEKCSAISSSAKFGFFMYLSYFGLFAELFYNNYIRKGGKRRGPSGTPALPASPLGANRASPRADSPSQGSAATAASSLSKAFFNPGKKLKK